MLKARFGSASRDMPAVKFFQHLAELKFKIKNTQSKVNSSCLDELPRFQTEADTFLELTW